MPTLANLIAFAFLFIVVGFIGGALVSIFWTEHVKPSKDEPKPRNPPGSQKGKYQELACLWREQSKDDLVTEISGETYQSSNEINQQQRNKLKQLAREWLIWLGVSMEVSAEQAITSVQLGEKPAGQPAFDSTNAQQIPVKDEETLITPQAALLIDQKKASEADSDSKPLSPPASIVAQINDVLQDMLADLPLASRDIHLSEDKYHNVIVWVGSEQFSGIDAVTDLDVKAIIRSAVAEWERVTAKHNKR